MAVLTVQNVVQTGLEPTFTSASTGGDTFANPSDETTFLYVKNGGSSSVTVSINPFVTTAKVPGAGTLTVTPISVVVPGTDGEVMIGPFPQAVFTAAGRVNVQYSEVTSVTVAAIRIAPVSR